MALSRRQFVQTAGIGAGAALTGSVWGRGRENSVWSAFEPDLAGRRKGVICIASNENPVGPGKKVLDTLRRCSKAAPSPAATRTRPASSPRQSRPLQGQARQRAGQRRIDRDSPRRHAGLHLEDQGARRHHSDLRGMRRLRRADRQPGPRRQADSEFKIDLDPMAAAAKGAGLVFYCNPNNPTATYVGAKATRDFLAKLNSASPDTTVLVDEAYFDYVTDPDHETHVPLAIENPRVIVARTFSKAYGMAGLRQGYAIAPRRDDQEDAPWVGSERHRVAQRVRHGGRDRRHRAGRDVHHERARAQQGRARLDDEVVRRSRHEADRLPGQLHVRQHRHAGARRSATPAAPRASWSRATSRRSRRRTPASRSARWKR